MHFVRRMNFVAQSYDTTVYILNQCICRSDNDQITLLAQCWQSKSPRFPSACFCTHKDDAGCFVGQPCLDFSLKVKGAQPIKISVAALVESYALSLQPNHG